MRSPATIGAALADKLAAIPALSDYAIGFFEDDFPERPNAAKAIANIGSGDAACKAMLVVYQGTQPVNRPQSGATWLHRFTVWIIGRSYAQLVADVINGVPAGGDGQKFLNTSIDSRCDLMDPPTISRDPGGEAHDLFKIDVALPEIGDN